MKVVIVDDSAEIRQRLTAMLGEIPGVEIAGQATTVAEAVNAVHLLKPDVIILDLRLPLGNGLEVLRLIQREQVQTRVIVLTNYAYPQYEKRARAAGAYAFLNKAKEFGRVAALVRSLMPGSEPATEKLV
jgi:DNA-binding NarL/FixJ family response regulator